MNKLNVALAYHAGDLELAQQLLAWISEQNKGAKLNRHLVLLGDGGLNKDQRISMKEMALEVFHSVSALPVHVQNPGWPTGPNAMFRQAMRCVQEYLRGPFLWMEPDCVTIKPQWDEILEEAYFSQPFRYFGTLSVRGEQGDSSLPDKWMSGVGVYPNDAYADLAQFCDSEKPFDVVAASSLTPRLSVTNLIQQHWGKKDLPPTFVTGKPKGPNAVGRDFLHPEAVIFHRCKDGSLFRLLSGQPTVVVTEEEEPVPVAPPKAAPQTPPLPPKGPVVPVAPSDHSQFGGGLTKLMKQTQDGSAPLRPS